MPLHFAKPLLRSAPFCHILLRSSGVPQAALADTRFQLHSRMTGLTPIVLDLDGVIVESNLIGADISVSSPEEFGAFMKTEREKWARVIKAAGIRRE